jgi:hypothetical protein
MLALELSLSILTNLYFFIYSFAICALLKDRHACLQVSYPVLDLPYSLGKVKSCHKNTCTLLKAFKTWPFVVYKMSSRPCELGLGYGPPSSLVMLAAPRYSHHKYGSWNCQCSQSRLYGRPSSSIMLLYGIQLFMFCLRDERCRRG